MGFIYGLIDGDTLELRYIGKTTKSPEFRFSRHRFGHGPNIHLNRWLFCTNANVIILEYNPENLDEAERHWIREMRKQGARLLNIADGGGGCGVHSLETRAKISTTKLMRPLSIESRARIGAARRGKPGFFLGRTHTDETKVKMSAKRKERIISKMTRIKISNSLRGRKLSDEHRNKISLAAKKRIYLRNTIGEFC